MTFERQEKCSEKTPSGIAQNSTIIVQKPCGELPEPFKKQCTFFLDQNLSMADGTIPLQQLIHVS